MVDQEKMVCVEVFKIIIILSIFFFLFSEYYKKCFDNTSKKCKKKKKCRDKFDSGIMILELNSTRQATCVTRVGNCSSYGRELIIP